MPPWQTALIPYAAVHDVMFATRVTLATGTWKTEG